MTCLDKWFCQFEWITGDVSLFIQSFSASAACWSQTSGNLGTNQCRYLQTYSLWMLVDHVGARETNFGVRLKFLCPLYTVYCDIVLYRQNCDSVVRPLLLASWYWVVSKTQKQMARSGILHEKSIYPETLFWSELVCQIEPTKPRVDRTWLLLGGPRA